MEILFNVILKLIIAFIAPIINSIVKWFAWRVKRRRRKRRMRKFAEQYLPYLTRLAIGNEKTATIHVTVVHSNPSICISVKII